MPLPHGFVYLETVDPTILQEPRYAGHHNFIGRPIAGYEAARCVVSASMAKALAQVQAELKRHNLTLKVYDGYRPLRAVANFVKWAQDPLDQGMKAEFYAHVDKKDLFDLGFIGLRSQHTRGAAVDLTLVPLPLPTQPTYQVGDPLVDGIKPYGERFADNSIDMGTGFDCFHDLSHTDHPHIQGDARRNRDFLRTIMAKHGLVGYSKEWWHFSLKEEPFPDTYFDFIIS